MVYNLLTAFSLAAPNAEVPAFSSWKVWPLWQPYSFRLPHLCLAHFSFGCFPLSSPKGRRPRAVEKSECNDKRKMKWQKTVICSAKSIKRQAINLHHRLGKTEVNYVAIQDSCIVVLCVVRVLLSQVGFDIQFYFFFENKYCPRQQVQFLFCWNVSGGFKSCSGSHWRLAKEISFYWLTWREERRNPSKKTHHQKLLSPIIPLNDVSPCTEL